MTTTTVHCPHCGAPARLPVLVAEASLEREDFGYTHDQLVVKFATQWIDHTCKERP